jgi:hypothetical protein
VYSNGIHMFSKCILVAALHTSLALVFIYCRYKFTITKLIKLHSNQTAESEIVFCQAFTILKKIIKFQSLITSIFYVKN